MPKNKQMRPSDIGSLNLFILWIVFLLVGSGLAGIIAYTNQKRQMSQHQGAVSQRALSYHPKNQKHTIEPRPHFPKNRLTGSERNLFVKLHNDFRKINKAPQLKWDKRLADSAQAWADKLYVDGCAMYHPKNKRDDREFLHGGADGQNLSQFVYTGTQNQNLKVGSIRDAFRLWTDECQAYDPKHPTKHNVGHFTQLIWKDTDKVGCAYRELDKPGKRASIYVCHYNKSGNWLTEDGGFALFGENVETSPVCI